MIVLFWWKFVGTVNVASKCGYTYTNYRELRDLYEKYHDSGLEIMAFPSNQFGNLEPGSDLEIQQYVEKQGIKFPVFAKVCFFSLFQS